MLLPTPVVEDFRESNGEILAFLAFSLLRANGFCEAYGESFVFLAFSPLYANGFREAYGEILAFLVFSLQYVYWFPQSLRGNSCFSCFSPAARQKQEGPTHFCMSAKWIGLSYQFIFLSRPTARRQRRRRPPRAGSLPLLSWES